MIDLYLKASTEAEMRTALVEAGVLVDADNGLYPASGISVDNIGPFVRWNYNVEPPVETQYPDWHVNVRAAELSDAQLKILEPFTLAPPQTPYRVWA